MAASGFRMLRSYCAKYKKKALGSPKSRKFVQFNKFFLAFSKLRAKFNMDLTSIKGNYGQ